jgi:Icc-related predicted phosphoesterase
MEDFRKKRKIPVYLDFGNDDFAGNRNILEEYDGELLYLLHDRKYSLTDTADIIGYMNVPVTPFGRKDFEKTDTPEQLFAPMNDVFLEGYISHSGRLERTVLQLDSNHTIAHDLERLSLFIDKPFIFVSHAPPYDTPLDVLYDGLHVGSLGIRNFIEYWSAKGKLIASFHGHIHESPGRSGSIQTKIGNSLCINPGQSSGPGARLRYVIFELADKSRHPRIRIISSP